MAVTLAELARRFGGKVRGNPDIQIDRAAPLDQAGPRDISFATSRKYLAQLTHTGIGAIILAPDVAETYSGNILIADDPHLCFARIATLLHPPPSRPPGVDPAARVSAEARVPPSAAVGPFAVVEAGAVLGEHAAVGPGCYVGGNAVIGDNTVLAANVVVMPDCVIGHNCLLHPGVVIGSDGFGYARDGEKWFKVPQLGRVVIGDAVEIGANTAVDRGALGDTVIGNGVKLDNQIQVAHNVRIGENTAVAACVGIAGSAIIGCRCTIGGHATILGHLVIADEVHITAGSLVTNSISRSGTYSSSLKAEPVAVWRRNAARLHQLDELARRVRQLEAEVERLSREQKT